MESKICVVCNTEKRFDNFSNKYRECKECMINIKLKRCYEYKDKLSDQRKKNMEKIEMCYLQSLN